MTALDFVILGLASWRLAYMLVNEDGPGAVFSRLRYRLGVRSVVTRGNNSQPEATKVATNAVAELWTCVWCMSFWAALLLAVPWEPIYWLRLVLAASGLAVLVNEAVERMRR